MNADAPKMGGTVPPEDNRLDTPSLHMSRQSNLYRMLTQEKVSALTNMVLNVWGGEEQFVRSLPKGHPAHEYVRRVFGEPVDFALLDKVVRQHPKELILVVPVLYSEDAAGHVLRQVELEPRGESVEAPPQVENALLVVVPQLALLHRPAALNYVEMPGRAILHASPARSKVEARVLTMARAAQHEQEALAAFDTLFRHYSLNEELWRLEEWMEHWLPFTLEEHPKMAEYRAMLRKQIRHLDSEADWYANGSPNAGISIDYVKGAARPGGEPLRVTWMMEEARKRGFHRVAEFGSVEGLNLFYYVQQCPSVEWVGFEASAAAVARGHELAKEAGLTNFHLEPMRNLPQHREMFDAVALFEVLEHNRGPSAAKVLAQAESLVKPGGWVYITTPHGNWSLFDEHTQDIALPKDHINGFTVRRMGDFLKTHGNFVPGTLYVEKVDNPSYHECNAWVMAQYQKAKKRT